MRVRAAAITLAASFLTSAALLLPGPATAAEACVGVVVDARLAGGSLSTSCAPGDPDSGLEALTKAGHSYAFVPQYPGLVCSIDGTPECSRTTSTSYWSYWYRKPGSDTWTYSSTGAGARDPEPGSTEAWVWQDGGRRQPPDIALARICPQVTQSPSAKPSKHPEKTATAAPEQSASAAPVTPPAAGSASATTAQGRRPARTSGEPSGTASAPNASTSPAGTISSAVEPTSLSTTSTAAKRTSGGTSPITGLAGAALILLLGGAAVWRARRRTDRA